MATSVGNLSGVVKLKESQYEKMIDGTDASYSDTSLYLIENVADKLLWKNQNPTSGMTPQFINIQDCSDYRYLFVAFSLRNDANTVGITYQKFVNPFYKGVDIDMKNRKWFYLSGISENGYTYQRHIKPMGPTIFYIMYGYTSTPNGSPQYQQLNYACTPLEIIGTNRL